MNEHELQLQQILLALEKLKFQYELLVADAESEKETRRSRNTKIDTRLDALEIDKIKRDTTIKNFIILAGAIGTIAGIILTLVAKYIFK